MKKLIHLCFAFIALNFTACNQNGNKFPENQEIQKIRVGVFDKNGDSPYCITDALEALRIDPAICAKSISAADIVLGRADSLDVILFPGGSGRAETGSLGEIGQTKIQKLVIEKGVGVIGICAGAYILSETSGYPSLGLSGAQAIDIEHDNRGHGLVQFKLTEEGKKLFPELISREINFSQYYEGPVLIPAQNTQYPYKELATMLSDVHTVEGSPENMTNNRPFIIVTHAGNGKTASVVGHPECSPGMRWIIPRLARIVSNQEIISYPKQVVRPEIYNQEILFTDQQRKVQNNAYSKLLGTKIEKLEAMQQLVDMCAWSAKKWIPPMLRDNDFDVRRKAAELTVFLERTDAIKDLEAATKCETNPDQKKILEDYLHALLKIRAAN